MGYFRSMPSLTCNFHNGFGANAPFAKNPIWHKYELKKLTLNCNNVKLFCTTLLLKFKHSEKAARFEILYFTLLHFVNFCSFLEIFEIMKVTLPYKILESQYKLLNNYVIVMNARKEAVVSIIRIAQ